MDQISTRQLDKTERDRVTLVDAIGQLCPMPVLRASQAMKQLKVGDEMELLATDPGSKMDIPAWVRMTGNELLEVVEETLREKQRLSLQAAGGEPADDSILVYKFTIRKLK